MPYYHRRNPRLKGFDYKSDADYFVTICTADRKYLFGEIINSDPSIILGEALIPDPRIETESSSDSNPNVGASFMAPSTGVDLTIARTQFPDVITKYSPGEMKLNETGKQIKGLWENLPQKFPVELDEYQIMPNHIHADLSLMNEEASKNGKPVYILGEMIRSFKAEASHLIGQHLWQRGYYDHIIWDYDDYKRIRTYIVLNPKIWARDRNNHKNFSVGLRA
ncbi:MAG: hypothetical protein NT141_00365 [candidate division WWE3 bacterium]|nr:hypothetical protein [candidate division WWE3 bacterium]